MAYAKKDRFDRTVGAVFNADCVLINLEQVRSGAAWYYEAYKCEIGSNLRNEYAAAQQAAQTGNLKTVA